MGDIIQIDQLKIERGRKGFCEHKYLCYDYENELIECKDCGLPVQPFTAFMVVVKNYNRAIDSLEHREQELIDLERRSEKSLLLATRELDRAWRRKMAVCCPHCGRGIIPDDVNRCHGISKEVELERRKFDKK
jgi:hypothetical protein